MYVPTYMIRRAAQTASLPSRTRYAHVALGCERAQFGAHFAVVSRPDSDFGRRHPPSLPPPPWPPGAARCFFEHKPSHGRNCDSQTARIHVPPVRTHMAVRAVDGGGMPKLAVKPRQGALAFLFRFPLSAEMQSSRRIACCYRHTAGNLRARKATAPPVRGFAPLPRKLTTRTLLSHPLRRFTNALRVHVRGSLREAMVRGKARRKSGS
ncbi:hypothetical protein BDY21DRAFT_333980 [Lineolata rhizophorae]|uniref:Uncharacterized protein n=1 Tax=Lineolata rhizophorae TaxID=578093 RepID=A0A6A6PAY2_9PEZI|nr:hypothetical protein BDY21DRAFT_333980 [Lineolata rhizophorae]